MADCKKCEATGYRDGIQPFGGETTFECQACDGTGNIGCRDQDCESEVLDGSEFCLSHEKMERNQRHCAMTARLLPCLCDFDDCAAEVDGPATFCEAHEPIPLSVSYTLNAILKVPGYTGQAAELRDALLFALKAEEGKRAPRLAGPVFW